MFYSLKKIAVLHFDRDLVPLPGLTPEGYKVSCYRMVDMDPGRVCNIILYIINNILIVCIFVLPQVNHTADTKAFFMVSDCRFNMYDGVISTEGHLETFASGEVQIFDMNGYTLKHLSKMTFSTLRIYMAFLQEALPVHLKAIHIINCPSYLDKIVSIMKPFISREVFKLVNCVNFIISLLKIYNNNNYSLNRFIFIP